MEIWTDKELVIYIFKKQSADLGRDGVLLRLLADFSSLSLCSFWRCFWGAACGHFVGSYRTFVASGETIAL